MSEVARTEPQRQEVSLLNFIASAVRDPSIDVNKLESLVRIQREIVAEQATQDFHRAMSAAQSEMRAIPRDARNTQTNSRYARLETIDDLIRPIYTGHGFSLTFSSEPPADPTNVRVVCEIAHEGGHVKRFSLEAAPDTMGAQGKVNKTALHGLGSTVSYLRRYLTCMIFNVTLTDEDNDGNGNGQRPAAASATPRPPVRRANGGQSWDKAPEVIPELEEPDGAKWLNNLRALLANAQSQEEVTTIGGYHTVGTAIAKAPPRIRRDITELLAEHFGRFEGAADDGSAANEVAGDEVVIVGEEKLAAG